VLRETYFSVTNQKKERICLFFIFFNFYHLSFFAMKAIGHFGIQCYLRCSKPNAQIFCYCQYLSLCHNATGSAFLSTLQQSIRNIAAITLSFRDISWMQHCNGGNKLSLTQLTSLEAMGLKQELVALALLILKGRDSRWLETWSKKNTLFCFMR